MEVQQEPLAELGDRAVLLQVEALKLVLEPWRWHLSDGFLGDITTPNLEKLGNEDLVEVP